MLIPYLSASSTLALLPAVLVAYIVLKLLYNVFLHPLRTFPGPLLARATVIIYQRKILQGRSHTWLLELHEKYGPVVRCAPNELSFIDPQVWKDVYGHRATHFTKEFEFYGPDPHGNPAGIVRADNESHAAQRRLISHAFSDKALREQEELLKSYATLMIERLQDVSVRGAVNIVDWFNFTTFDVMADLTFGESLGQLESSTYNPWVKAIFAYISVISLTRVCRSWPGVTAFMNAIVPAETNEKKKMHMAFSKERVDKRMARKTDRPDIWTFVTKNSEIEGKRLTQVLAGTETTATMLSGLTYLLLRNPEKLDRLKKEVRSVFSTFEDMTTTSLAQLAYLNACLEEGLRLYPPVPIGLVRRTPQGGANVCGHWVAGGTFVQCPFYAASRATMNWENPESFAPERFMPEGQAEYASDRKDAHNPFSYGPRNCLGKNLAYHEMRLLLSSLLFHFDIELRDKDIDWFDQPSHILWDKKPLSLDLTPIK